MIEWIDRRDRPPTKEDEDEQGCILVYHVYSGVRVSNSYNFNSLGGRFETHWAVMPAPPKIDPAFEREVRAR